MTHRAYGSIKYRLRKSRCKAYDALLNSGFDETRNMTGSILEQLGLNDLKPAARRRATIFFARQIVELNRLLITADSASRTILAGTRSSKVAQSVRRYQRKRSLPIEGQRAVAWHDRPAPKKKVQSGALHPLTDAEISVALPQLAWQAIQLGRVTRVADAMIRRAKRLTRSTKAQGAVATYGRVRRRAQRRGARLPPEP